MSVHSHLTGSTYRRRHTMQTKAKKWPPSQTRVADRVRGPMWRGTWLIGQAHETEGSYPRPRGATVGRSRRLLPHGLAWPRLTSGPWRGQRALSGVPYTDAQARAPQPALLRLPSAPPTGRSPGHERRTRTTMTPTTHHQRRPNLTITSSAHHQPTTNTQPTNDDERPANMNSRRESDQPT